MKNIRYSDKLYLGERIEQEELKTLKRDLEKYPHLANVYIITLSLNEHDQLDIYHAKYLLQRFYEKHPPLIVGIAKTKGDAYHLIEKITQECICLRGDVNLKAFLIGE